MKTQLLGDICEVNPRTDANLEPAQACSFVPMEYVDDRFGIITRQDTRTVREVGSGYTFFRDDDVLFAKITPCMENGKAAVARGLVNGIGFGSTEFHVVRPSKGVLPELIFHFLRQEKVRKYAKRRMKGSAGQQRVPSIVLEELEIHLPDLIEDQKRIAAALNNADRLRRTRRFAQQLSDTFLQSVFVEMFGDPVKNPKGWNVVSLRSLAEKFSDGPFGSNLKSEHYTERGIRVLRLQNIGVGELIDNDKEYISELHFNTLLKHSCVPGDVIVGTLGDPNLRACILPSSIPVALNKADCVQIRTNPDRANANYVCWLLNLPHTLFLATGMILGQTRSRISMGRLAELQVPVAPLIMQHKFAGIVQRFERLRSQQREAAQQAEHLFQTLVHKAFSGCL